MLVVSSISKTYPNAQSLALNDVGLACEAGSFTTLLGPSGCGKSTLLRCIAGLEDPEEGQISLGGQIFVDMAKGISLPASRRKIGMVFQSYAIWPHMSVAQNIGYPLRVRGDAERDIDLAVREVLDMVGLPGLGDRPSFGLSGGQQQRVAIARAVVSRPSLLLLDEPMSNLDAHLRRQLGGQLRSLQKKLGLTVVYVTHDRDEALTLSDNIVVLSAGRVVDRGAPLSLYNAPQSDRGALSVGEANFLPASVVVGQATCSLFSPPLRLPAPPECRSETTILLRPEWIEVSDAEACFDPSISRASATVIDVTFRGMMTEVDVRLDDATPLLVRVLLPLPLSPGQRVMLKVPSSVAHAVHRIGSTAGISEAVALAPSLALRAPLKAAARWRRLLKPFVRQPQPPKPEIRT